MVCPEILEALLNRALEILHQPLIEPKLNIRIVDRPLSKVFTEIRTFPWRALWVDQSERAGKSRAVPSIWVRGAAVHVVQRCNQGARLDRRADLIFIARR